MAIPLIRVTSPWYGWFQQELRNLCRIGSPHVVGSAYSIRQSKIRRYSKNAAAKENIKAELRLGTPRINAVITGATRGLGFAVASSLASRGAHCLLIARNEDALVSAKSHLHKLQLQWNPNMRNSPASDDRIASICGDVSTSNLWSSFSEHPWLQHNSPNVLVNAAGISQKRLLFGQQASEIRDILSTNLQGTALACKTVGNVMVRHHIKARKKFTVGDEYGADGRAGSPSFQSPCIINFSSILSHRGGRGSAIYAASKAGVLGLTQSLALEFGAMGVRVNAVAPGYIETSMTEESLDDSDRALLLERIPLKRFGHAAEIADAVNFLINNEYANNCVLNLDGGLSAVI